MNEKGKLGCKIMVGIVLWITVPFILAKLFGESILIVPLVIIGWVALFALTLKFIGLIQKGE